MQIFFIFFSAVFSLLAYIVVVSHVCISGAFSWFYMLWWLVCVCVCVRAYVENLNFTYYAPYQQRKFVFDEG
jgi:hypothetical protein